MRGSENVINGHRICDYCHASWRGIFVDGTFERKVAEVRAAMKTGNSVASILE